jgi:V8-like Glu-specific endopeptidase
MWFVSLSQVSITMGDYICGGTIIDSEHILTAAHCVHNPKNVPCTAQRNGGAGEKGTKIPECIWLPGNNCFF